MKYRLLIPLLTLAGLSLGFVRISDGSLYVRIARSLELMGEVFRQVSLNYVEDVDPEVVIEAGINGMLKSLDPYTSFVREEEADDLDQISSGTYTGFGITVSQVDSALTITGIRTDGPADRAGIRIGDRLVSIDGVMVDTMAPKSLRKHTRGSANVNVAVTLVRESRSDTIKLVMQRATIDIDNVVHYEVLPGGIAFVKLARFSRRAASEVRSALETMKSKQRLTGIVLDLRDNPGGLLEAAVGVTKLFVPRGSFIVATRGREASESRNFVSDTDPFDASLPLAILINEHSASASEIVAGAIQDVDRGIILGKKSFGKGLVQTVVPLPGDAQLKMTTSRYYTPSGRSIQRVNYASFRSQGTTIPSDTTVFTTQNGRSIRELSGIEPDTTVDDSSYPSMVRHLLDNNVLFRFASSYTSHLDSLPSNFSPDKAFESFVRHLDGVPAFKRSIVLRELADSRRRCEAEGFSQAVVRSIEQAERAAEKDFVRSIRQNADVIRPLLDIEIRSRFSSERERISLGLKADATLRAAVSILGGKRYATFLELPTAGEQ